ncbi:Fe-S cluster assembly protein SufD [Flammeovirga pacifica]|uniref:Fe-S cluster assembly protein SufD n=1 Tax=Flammeovirga pacifica TaxID=915059 RepID=A0A1S1YWB2_FLAPC|nr:Fe-S cluster assembly protein SufD [Flammeovirga pacifica]OHX65309.1 Fe-S cluster assembly protein SufD [Flammeovirga pacifica]
MSTVIENAALKNSALEYIEETIEAVPELVEVRTSAAEGFAENNFPSIKDEEWKYTNVKQLVSSNYAFDVKEAAISSDDIKGYLIEGVETLVFVNGKYNAGLSNFNSSEKVYINTFAEALNSDKKELLLENFGKHADNNLPFVGLNTASTTEGVFIHAKRNAIKEESVMILNVVSQSNLVIQPRLLVIAEEGTQISYVERNAILNNAEGTLVNAVSEVTIGERANVNHIKIQDEDQSTQLVTVTEAKQADNSVYDNVTITTGGKLVRNNLNISLGEHCEGHMTGLYLLDEKSFVDNHTMVDHKMPNSYSNELYKGILSGKSKAIFNGKIFVREDAQKTNAFQSNKNILLSPDAVVDTKPQLEIWADDVSCSHGCTVGALDEEPMFYLRARGIPEDQARALLTYAFAGDVIEKIKNEAIRNVVQRMVANAMGYPLD